MALEHDSDSALALAVRKAGSQTAFGELIGKRQSVVHDWLREETPLPGEYVFLVERELAVSRHVLRPDLYPREGCCAQACPEHGTEPREDPAPVAAGAASPPRGAGGSPALEGVRP